MRQINNSRRCLIRGGALLGIASTAPVAMLPSVAAAVDSTDGPYQSATSKTLRERILSLEKAAGRASLGGSGARRRGGGADDLQPSSLYLNGLPRLLDILDESSQRSLDIANEAAGLLAELNKMEKSAMPEFYTARKANNPSYQSLKNGYENDFSSLEVRPEHEKRVLWHRDFLIRFRARYESVAAKTEVPWHFIGIIHALEASFNFKAHLHNGDYPLTERTRQVPAKRPERWLPPSDWESSAIDAMQFMGFAGQSDWSLSRTLYRLEAYNGFGYRGRGIKTPYLWSFSNHYYSGKFVKDRVFDATAASQQCGAAVMLKALVNRGYVAL